MCRGTVGAALSIRIEVTREANTLRVFPRHQRNSCRRADIAGTVGPAEQDALLGQSVNVWRLVKLRPVATEIGPAEVINKDNHDVGLAFVTYGLAASETSGCQNCRGQSKESRKPKTAATHSYAQPFNRGRNSHSLFPFFRSGCRLLPDLAIFLLAFSDTNINRSF